MTKAEKMICGFCNKEIEKFKDLPTIKSGRKVILICPSCNSILGIYYA